MILYAMESAWNSPARTRGTKRMSVQAALTQTEDGGYSELETGGDQELEGGGAQTAQGEGRPKSGEKRKTDDVDEGESDRIVRGRLRRR
jgi:hypothetical protein